MFREMWRVGILEKGRAREVSVESELERNGEHGLVQTRCEEGAGGLIKHE